MDTQALPALQSQMTPRHRKGTPRSIVTIGGSCLIGTTTYRVFGHCLSSPASLLFAFFLSATTFFAVLNGGAGFGARLHERTARQDDMVSDVAALSQGCDALQPQTIWPLACLLAIEPAPRRILDAAGRTPAHPRGIETADIAGSTVLPPTRAPPAGDFQRA